MKRVLLLICSLFCFSQISHAATIDVERETRGYGGSYQEALSGALLEAVRQVRGLEVGTEKVLKRQITESVTARGGLVSESEERVATDIYTKSQGWIKTYEVIDVVEPDHQQGQWVVTTRVTVPVYQQALKNDRRKTVAVLPFDVDKDSIRIDGTNISGETLAKQLAQGVLSELVQSRKFAVVNRAFESQFQKEKNLLLSGDVSPEETSRLGQKLGADFIIVGNINRASLAKKDKTFYGLNRKTVDGSLGVFYTVIETATEKVMWADSKSFSYQSVADDNFMQALTDKLSFDIATNILDVIYPIKVLELSNESEILLNQGGKRLSKGIVLEVFTPGRTVNDPDSNLPIKVDGSKVAELEIIDVKPKYSVAKLVSGNYEKLQVNAIVRRVGMLDHQEQPPSNHRTPGMSDKPWSWD